ncbi:MAG: hypothetical protein IPN69_06965 [Acidobacteria bacterium]|nr:hypothetical protein [Acidobacteriota bacterium]
MSQKKPCQKTKRNGEPCQMAASESGFCFTHDPSRGKERADARRKGGMLKAVPHIADKSLVPDRVRSIDGVLSVLDYTLKETLGLANGVQRGRLLVSLAHGYIEALKTGELEQRLEAIEQAMKLRKVVDFPRKAN